MKKRLSISDIAKNLGVSVTTVSFILNDKAKEKRISEALTKRVLDYVNKVGYKPNQLAKSLRTGKSKTLGLLVEDISNSFFANIADQIEKLAYDFGYHIVYCSMNNDVNRAKELIQLFYDRQIDGFIIAPTEGLTEVIQKLLKNNVPVVLFDRHLEDLETNFVISENHNGAYLGTRFLLEEKRASRVGLVTINSNQLQMRGRMEGYMEAVDAMGKDMLIKKIVRSQVDEDTILQIRDFIQDNRLDGVLFATNYLALSGLKAIKRYDLDITKVVSFDENAVFSLVEPAVSAISQNIHEIARKVVDILINEINGKNQGLVQVVVPCEIIAR
ncbi:MULTISPECIES: LacI family DNA-binding transcriptional regulator [Sphingobacterium]|uniref:LacI family DNA-binding transcriptional regulator n=1 Tax=Sphingobacterium TaxID=28453 RepID=UPI0013D9F16E|nr:MULTISPECIES: LacI family DNA-binding transcriptional regulator [unclassified Sphingobacterium]